MAHWSNAKTSLSNEKRINFGDFKTLSACFFYIFFAARCNGGQKFPLSRAACVRVYSHYNHISHISWEGVDARLVGLGLLYTVSGIEIHLSNRHFSAKCNVKVCSLTAEWLTAHRRIRTTFLDTEQSPAGDSGAVKVNRQRELSSLCVVIGVV